MNGHAVTFREKKRKCKSVQVGYDPWCKKEGEIRKHTCICLLIFAKKKKIQSNKPEINKISCPQEAEGMMQEG